MSGGPPPELPGTSHRDVDAAGVRLHVAEAGEGEPVLLVHGWPQHWWMWRHLIPPLAERFRVLALDLRGFGWSDAPPGGYDKEQMASDVLAAADALGIERFRMVGHDWGGVAGFLVCLRAPERIERYIAMNTGHPFPSVGSPLDALRLAYQLPLAMPLLGPALMRTDLLARLVQRGGVEVKGAWSERDTELFMGQFDDPARARAASLVYRSFLLQDLPAWLGGRYRGARLRPRTLFLHGTHDVVVSPDQVRALEPHADALTIELTDEAGHFIAEEAPDLVRERTLSFLA